MNTLKKKIDYKDLLLNSYIAISDPMSGLKDIAYAKLVFLILFLEGKQLNIKELKEKIAQIINSISIPDKSLVQSIELLKSRHLIIESKNKWQIIDIEKEKTEKQVEYSKKVSVEICEKYFPKSIDQISILNWFEEVNEKYFSTFADRLIELYNKKKRLILDINRILEPLIIKYKLQKYQNELEQGYHEFLLSDNRQEEEKIWGLMQSLLSAKIVCADLSPDFLNIDKYRDAKILLDTNILFANSLASNRGIEEVVKSFGKVASTIGAKLYLVNETINEYKIVCERKRVEMLKIWETYSLDILKKSDKKDGFFRSIIDLQCKDSEDIERFFSAVCEIPKEIGGAEINLLDKKISDHMAYDRKKDLNLFNEIQNKWGELHEGAKKSEGVVIHDLIITKICKKLQSEEKFFVLTLDMSLEALSLSWINEKENPIWRSLYSLVQILAINGGGPNFDAKDMAPLVKIFIEQEDLGRSDGYDKRDLLFLTEISDRIEELSDTKVVSLLNKIHLAHLSGNRNEQVVRDVKLELERSLINNTYQLNETLSERNEKIVNLKEQLNDEKVEKNKIKQQRQWLWFIIKTLLKFILSFVLFMYFGDQIKDYFQLGLFFEFLQIIVFISSPIYSVIKDYSKTKEVIKAF